MNMLAYLKNPELIQASERGVFKKLKQLLILFLAYLGCIMVVGFLLRLIDHLLIRNYFNHSILHQMMLNMKDISSGFGRYWFIVLLLLLGPFLEELLFRLPLQLEKITIGIALTLISYRLLVDHSYSFNYSEVSAYLKVVAALVVFLLTIRFFPDSALAFLKRHYGYYFYSVAITFALVHLQNFQYFETNVLLLYPLFTLPQFVMGLFIGYVRMEYGFVYGVLFHSLINLPSFLLSPFAGLMGI